MEATNKLDLKSEDFEQQCLRNILARTTALATISEDKEELGIYSSIAMALASCSKDIERGTLRNAFQNYLSDEDECNGDCENCELCCNDEFDEDDF